MSDELRRMEEALRQRERRFNTFLAAATWLGITILIILEAVLEAYT